jgi:hypothetical protein
VNDSLVIYVLDPAVNYRHVVRLVTVYRVGDREQLQPLSTVVGKAAIRKARKRADAARAIVTSEGV